MIIFNLNYCKKINSSDSVITNFKDLQYTLQRVLDKQTNAPLKKRYVRANQQNFMDKELK